MIAVDEISGILDHSDLCDEQTVMERDPCVPLHPELRAYALGLLRKNTPLALLRTECLAWAEKRWPSAGPGNNQARFQLTLHDSCSLYRTIAAEQGVPQRSSAEANLDLWFRKTKPAPPSNLLTAASRHYQPHIHPDTDRFELVLITKEMEQAAWNYGHKQQVSIDLTFGFCSARALLIILMAFNEDGHGIPIGFIVFTARDSAKATHADYNTQLLTRLLGKYKEALGRNHAGEEFEIGVANTDNDLRERAALAAHWPGALLLLCTFHSMQAWRNNLNKAIGKIPREQREARAEVRKRLGIFLRAVLNDITNHGEATALYDAEVTHWTKESRRRTDLSKRKGAAALKFLTYFKTYIVSQPFWMSWSISGAREAATLLGIPVARVARTNNALESFNGRIKGGYIEPYRHSGRQPRIDVWVNVIITKVIPAFFDKVKREKAMRDYKKGLRVTTAPTAVSSEPDFAEDSGIESARAELVTRWLQDLDNGVEDADEEDVIEEQSENEMSKDEIEYVDDSEEDRSPIEDPEHEAVTAYVIQFFKLQKSTI